MTTPAPNPYLSRDHKVALVSHDGTGPLSWSIAGARSSDGTDTFIAGGSFGTEVNGLRLVLQDDQAYALQLDGSWLWGTRWGKKKTTVVVNDPLAPVVTPPVTPPPVTPPTVVWPVVHPSKALTSAKYADHALYTLWQKPMGDWFDADGVLNGPKPTISVTGTTVTVDVHALGGDFMVQGPPIKQVILDGVDVTEAVFWTSPDSAYSQHMPSNGKPVIVPNPGAASTLVIVANGKTAGTWRIDRLACPAASIPNAVPGFRSPDLLHIEPTSYDAVVIKGSIPAASTVANRCWGGDHIFMATDNDVPFVRCHPPKVYEPVHGAGRIMRVDYPLGPQKELHVGFLVRFSPNFASMAADGIKLSGGYADGANESRLFLGEARTIYYGQRNLRNLPIIALSDYFLSAEATSGQGAGNEQYTDHNCGYIFNGDKFVYVEVGMIPGTFKADGTPNNDGRKTTEINGFQVENRAIPWFLRSTSRWTGAQKQLYNGGTTSLLGDCWVDDGPFMVSTQRIGVDPRFMALL